MLPRGINVAPQSGPGPYYFQISHSMYDFQGELHGKYRTQSWNTTMSRALNSAYMKQNVYCHLSVHEISEWYRNIAYASNNANI